MRFDSFSDEGLGKDLVLVIALFSFLSGIALSLGLILVAFCFLVICFAIFKYGQNAGNENDEI